MFKRYVVYYWKSLETNKIVLCFFAILCGVLFARSSKSWWTLIDYIMDLGYKLYLEKHPKQQGLGWDSCLFGVLLFENYWSLVAKEVMEVGMYENWSICCWVSQFKRIRERHGKDSRLREDWMLKMDVWEREREFLIIKC